MSTQDEREALAEQKDLEAQEKRAEWDAESKRLADKRQRYERKASKTKDIFLTAVIASVITILVVTVFGLLTTQAVVEQAREEGIKQLVTLRASICVVRFQQRPDAEAKLAEFKAISWSEQDAAVQEFVTQEGLATMVDEDTPAPGAVEKCAEAILRS